MNAKHLNLAERYYIEIEHRKGTSQNQIGKSLNRSQGTISRELKRNTRLKGYRHKQAMNSTQERHKSKAKKVKLSEDIQRRIDHYIEQDWSPEQIAGRFKKKNIISLHHETIYQHIYRDKEEGGDLYTHLRCQGKRYRKRATTTRNLIGIPNRVDIEERPEIANKRKRVGDWEADTIVGKKHQGAILTLDERKSKLRLAYPLLGRKAVYAKGAAILLLSRIKEFVQTITFDNGREFTQHEKIAKALGCDTYFAKPYHSWERGQNENANGLLRQYFPKGTSLIGITVRQVLTAVDRLNNRPRKCLKYQTPYEVFKKLTGVDIKKLMGYALMT